MLNLHKFISHLYLDIYLSILLRVLVNDYQSCFPIFTFSSPREGKKIDHNESTPALLVNSNQ